jgi:tetratricopeptide (TPR) repeat protein
VTRDIAAAPRALLLLAGAVLVLCVPLLGAARADTPPGTWDIARDPAERERWMLHVQVQNLMNAPETEETQPLEILRDSQIQLELARALLEQADAAHSPDVRLRFDLGVVYERLGDAQERDDLHERAVAVLAPALDAAADHPAATAALQYLAYAYAHLDKAREELAAWRRYVPRVIDDRFRVVDMMNMGEAEMRLGLVDDALGTFREVLRMCGQLPNTSTPNSTYVLTLWDLAVALDRSGDPRGAVDTAAKASAMVTIGSTRLPRPGRWIIASDPKVFFVPAWEREWYLALASSAAARDAHDARDAAVEWAEAERHWDTYVSRSTASGSGGPWLAIARLRRDATHALRAAADKRAAKMPRRAAPGRTWADD